MIGLQARVYSMAAALALAALLASPAHGADDEKWMLRTGLAGLNSTGGLAASDARIGQRIDFGGGLAVALEHRLGPRLGVEFSGVYAGLGSGLAVTVPSRPFGTSGGSNSRSYLPALNLRLRDYVPLSAALNFRLTPDAAANVYVGPMLTYSILGEVGMDVSAGSVGIRTRNDNNLGFGFQAGIDIPFGQRRWGLHSSLKYLNVSHEFIDGVKANLNPLIVTAGISFRF